MNTRVIEAPLGELARRVGAGELSCRDVVRAFLERIGDVDGRVGAFLECRAEVALAEAAAADEARARGAARSPLHGLPLAVKDILVSPDFDTTCGSRILAGYRSPFRATALERLAHAGLVVLGRLNMDEFAMGSSCENSAFQVTRNPWDPERVPGGSSGGSAAAVAAREVPAALGTDTGGSIRQPAALCGVAGMKPTYGRVSRYGLVAFASSLDQIGPLANDVADLATLLGVVAGHDPKDATSFEVPVPDYEAALTGDVDGLCVGLVREMFEADGADPDVLERVREAVRELERRGAKTVEVSLPHTSYGVAAYYLLATAEASSNLARYDGVKFGYRVPAEDLDAMYRRTRSQGFGREVKRRILLGTYVLSAGYYDAYYRKAQRVRTLIRRDFDRALSECDVLVAPTTPGAAWKLGERVEDPIQMYLADVFTVTVSLAGLPALSVPCGFTRAGLPVGWQIIGRPLDEGTVLRVGDAYQRETHWHRTLPEL